MQKVILYFCVYSLLETINNNPSMPAAKRKTEKSQLTMTIPKIDNYRDDNIELRNRIMAITPEERKKLKINKSTLWYRQKAIKEGKRIKIYTKKDYK